MDRTEFEYEYVKELKIIMIFAEDWMSILDAAIMRDKALKKIDKCKSLEEKNKLLTKLIFEAKKPCFEVEAHGIFKKWCEKHNYKHLVSSDTKIDDITDLIISNNKNKSLHEWKKRLIQWLTLNKKKVVECNEISIEKLKEIEKYVNKECSKHGLDFSLFLQINDYDGYTKNLCNYVMLMFDRLHNHCKQNNIKLTLSLPDDIAAIHSVVFCNNCNIPVSCLKDSVYCYRCGKKLKDKTPHSYGGEKIYINTYKSDKK